MCRLFTLIAILFIATLSACTAVPTTNHTATPTPTVVALVDSFFYGYAYLDANNNGQLDDSDPPLSGAQFTAADAKGVSAGGKTDSEGSAMAWWPAESQYPVTLRMTPPEGYTLVSPQEVVLEQGEANGKFLFKADVNTSSPDSTPAANNISSNTQYTLTAVLNYASHFLAVDEQISYTNQTTETLDDILLIVEAQRYTGAFKLNGVSLNNGDIITPTWDVNWMTLPLTQPLEPDQSLQLSLSYVLTLPFPKASEIVRPVPFGYTERQTNLVDWYPYIPPRIPGQGWMAHKPGYFGEHLAYEYSDFQVDIMISDIPASSFAVPTPTGDQPTAGYAIAASSPAQMDGDWRRYHLESARNFVWSVSHAYQVFTKQVGDVTVLGYSFPVHSKAGQTALDVTAQSFELYQELYGLYPHQTLSVVEADFLDGMEYDGLYFLSNGFYNLYTGTPSDYLTDIAAHETAHQWFFGIVGNDQGQEPWLDESLCTYSERLYYEKYSPAGLDWWWKYRINFYKPTGFIDGSIFSFNNTSNPYESYRNAVYLNGAMFMDDLRKLIGDDVFLAFMKDYVTQNQGKIVTTAVFFDILKQHTQADISELVNKYFSKKY